MLPTLLPLLGLNRGYVQSGRDLLAKATNASDSLPDISLSYYGEARSQKGSWKLGDPNSFMCSPPRVGGDCRFDAELDARARARIGLLDWNVRATLR